jgi:DNA-binding IclR family transcriptional regulator
MRTIDRALAVFDCFTRERPSLSLLDISRCASLPKATTSRVVQALEARGYLVRLENQRYSLSFKLVRLAGIVESTLDVRQAGRPVLEKLARTWHESVTLSTVEGLYRVCVDVVNTPSPLMTLTKPGEHYRLGVGATSLMLMASLPPPVLDRVLRSMPRKAGQTRQKIVSVLKSVQKQGYAVSHGGRVAGLSGIAVPVNNADGVAHYCLSIVLPTVRAADRVPDLIRSALKAGAELSHRLGAPNSNTKEKK